MIHRLKTLPQYYQPVIEKRKPFEIRKNDRNFQTGDSVILNEWDGSEYTGRFCVAIILDVFDISFLLPSYVAFTIKILGEFEEIKNKKINTRRVSKR